MKGEVYGREIFSTCWNGQKQSKVEILREIETLIKVENQTLVKKVNFKLKKNVTA
jgi:hypothetical protein